MVGERDVDDVGVGHTEHLVDVGEPRNAPLPRSSLGTRGDDVAHRHEVDGGVVHDGLQVVS